MIRPPAGLPVRLVPIPTPAAEEARPATGFGCCRGMIWMADDFDAHHRDPIDRLLVAQALTEGMDMLSADTAFDADGVGRVW